MNTHMFQTTGPSFYLHFFFLFNFELEIVHHQTQLFVTETNIY